MGLRYSFKNFRRGLKRENSDDTLAPAKHPKLIEEDLTDEDSTEKDVTKEEYEDAIVELQGMGIDS